MMWLIAIICVLFGVVFALVLQAYFLYVFFLKLPELKPECRPHRTSECKLPEELLKLIADNAWRERRESCNALNLIFQFLFHEWKDTRQLRRWLIKKLNGEFLEMQRTATGRFLENITIRDLQLGSDLPVLRNIAICDVSLHENKRTMQELTLSMEVEYDGGFELAVDVDMVLGRSASVAVRVSKLQGKARLQFTRHPFSHWSFSFMEEPHIEFAVSPQFQGRQVPQLTSIIIHQIRRAIRKKHTLPNYKIRFHPYLPSPQVSCPNVPPSEQTTSEGILEVEVIKCTRLCSVPSHPSFLYCTLAMDAVPWAESAPLKGKTWGSHSLEMNCREGQALGLVLKQEFVAEKMDNCIMVKSISPNSCASSAGLKKNDILVSIGNKNVTQVKQAVKLFKSSDSKILVSVERKLEASTGSSKNAAQTCDGESNSTNSSPRKSSTNKHASAGKVLHESSQTSDPETLLDPGKIKKTSSVKASKEPEWKESFSFQLLPHHRYVNVGIWCSSEQMDILLGRVSISAVSVVEDCAFTTLGIHTQKFQLLPPNSLLDRCCLLITLLTSGARSGAASLSESSNPNGTW